MSLLCDHGTDVVNRVCPRCVCAEAAWFDALGPAHAFTRHATPRTQWRGFVATACTPIDSTSTAPIVA